MPRAANHVRPPAPGADQDANTAARIEQAALGLFMAKGYAGASTRDIAAGTGLAMSTLFHHFATKQQILLVILERAVDELQAELDVALDGASAPRDRLHLALRTLVLAHCRRREYSFVAQSELRSLDEASADVIRAKRVRIQRVFDTAIEDGIADGTFRCSTPQLTARAILTMSTQVAVWYREDGALTPEQVADGYVALADRMVGADAPR